MNRGIFVLLGALSLVGLVGCSTDSTVDVTNRTNDPTQAVLTIDSSGPMLDGTSKKLTYKLVNGQGRTVQWFTSAGTIAADGTFTSPQNAGTVTVRAALAENPFVASSLDIDVHKLSVTANPHQLTLAPGAMARVGAVVAGNITEDGSVNFNPIGGKGSVDPYGFYTAPSLDGVYALRASSATDPRKFDDIVIVVGSDVSVGVSPVETNLPLGGSQQFVANVFGTSTQDVVWTASGGSVSASGLFSATQSGTFTVRATSVKDPSKFGEATVRSGAVQIYTLPSQAIVQFGKTFQFTAALLGATNTAVLWSTTGGSIDQNGLYSASLAGNWQVTATSMADPSKLGTANIVVVTLNDGVQVFVTPTVGQAYTGNQIQFTVYVFGANNPAVVWGCTGGTITQNGLFTAGAVGDATIVATSLENPGKTASAAIKIVALPTASPRSLR